MQNFDVCVIGGGVIGGTILRELTKYNLSVCLIEKENDVCMGQSKANSGIVHAGFDAKEGTLKAKFNVLGSKMMPNLAKELGVKYYNNGSLVLAFNEDEEKSIDELFVRGKNNGVEGLEILSKEQVLSLEKNVSKNVKKALNAKTGGIVCPYELTISAIGNAMDNGAKLFTNFNIVSVKSYNDGYIIKNEKGEEIFAKTFINSAGSGSESVAKLFGDNSVEIGYRRGEYMLLDKEVGNLVKTTVFRAPTKVGKGILVSPTADKNIILGPTAEEIENNDTKTTSMGLSFVKQKANELVENISMSAVITSFSGVRAYSKKHDFTIEYSSSASGLINVVGIESPGLTSSPAIAKYVVENLVSKRHVLSKNENFNGIRKPDYFFKNLSIEEKNELIKKDEKYGKIVCRCEEITEGEIVNAIRSNPPARDIDGIKRRTRAGMGRCQSGFCTVRVVEILARELGVSVEEITKKGNNSYLLEGKTK